MKTITTILLALGIAGAAQAQSHDYQHAASRLEFCKNVKGLAGTVYSGRVLGKPKQRYIDLAGDALNKGDGGDAVLRFAIDYAYDKAEGIMDAENTVWARCMDSTT